MNYTLWATDNLTLSYLSVRNAQVAIWRSQFVAGRPLIMLVHGITGDHFGLVPLIQELSKTYNCLLVELPGHGKSEPIEIYTATALQTWFFELYQEVIKSDGIVSVICAHSFGCTAVVGGQRFSDETKIVLINPVPHPSKLYEEYAEIIMKFAGFWAFFYNWRMFVFLRSVTLAKVGGQEPHNRIGWVSRYSKPSYTQVVYQARLVDIILDTSAYCGAKNHIDLVICGMEDTTASQRDSLELHEIFGQTTIRFLRGGHLLPIETPNRVAQVIRDAMIN